jgi:hypothetical protein
MASQDLIKVRPDASNKANTNPMALLISYNKKHVDLRPFSKTSSGNEGGDGNGKKMVLVTLKIVRSHWTSLIRSDPDDVKALNASSEERKGTSMLTVSEVRKMLDNYIEREGLVVPNNPGEVILDGPLTDAIYGNETLHDKIPEKIWISCTRVDIFRPMLWWKCLEAKSQSLPEGCLPRCNLKFHGDNLTSLSRVHGDWKNSGSILSTSAKMSNSVWPFPHLSMQILHLLGMQHCQRRDTLNSSLVQILSVSWRLCFLAMSPFQIMEA